MLQQAIRSQVTKLSAADRTSYKLQFGLSDPSWLQYLRSLRDIAAGNLGHSFFRAERVGDMILRRGPLTPEIAILSAVLSWIVGVPVA